MSDVFSSAGRKAVMLAVPLFLVAAIWQIAINPLLDLHRDLDEHLERSQGLLQRYRSLGSHEAEVKSALQHLKEESAPEELVYNTQNVNTAATLLQQRLGEIVAASGSQIRAARVEIKPKTASYQPFAVNLTFATSTVGLTKLLFQLETLRPVVFVDNVFIQAGAPLLGLQHNQGSSDKGKVAAEDQVLDVALAASAFALAKE
jgi:general secretion pathway protein M